MDDITRKRQEKTAAAPQPPSETWQLQHIDDLSEGVCISEGGLVIIAVYPLNKTGVCMSPSAARQLAAALLDAANRLDPATPTG